MMRRESDYHRSAYVRMCQKRNDDRKELIKKIKRADLDVMVFKYCFTSIAARKGEYRDGLIDAFNIMYGDDETARLWDYLDCRRARVQRYIDYKLRARWD